MREPSWEPRLTGIASICRHSPGDPNCGSYRGGGGYSSYESASSSTPSPDPDKYEVVQAEAVGNHLVMQVRYPNCSRCEYEGLKTMVFLNTSAMDALRWKRIDPHFRAKTLGAKEAPSPAARFPGNKDGWEDARAYAQHKIK